MVLAPCGSQWRDDGEPAYGRLLFQAGSRSPYAPKGASSILTVHVPDGLYRHSSNAAHGVEVPAGARLLFTNGLVGTTLDGTTPETTAEQAEVVFSRVEAVLAAANMALSDIAPFTVFLTDQEGVATFVEGRDRVLA